MEEVEVFRLTKFDENKCYEFALKTRSQGRWPNEKHYTTNPLQYLGRYTHSEEWGYHDNHGGAEYFDDNGKVNRIEYDYEGKTCFREVPCSNEFLLKNGGKMKNGGKRKSKRKPNRTRKNKKSKKNRKKITRRH
jgi:hypothetical protein